MRHVFQAAGLVKRFGKTTALAGVDMDVREGEVHGFLGPNGAGKSTTIRILLGLLRADGGSVSLLGGDPWRDVTDLHRRLAYVPGDVSLWPTLTGGETIDLLGRLRGGLDVRRRAELVERFELDPRKKGRSYSKGNRQKVALIAALASNAEFLVLDEPTSGLDPLMMEVFKDCVAEARGEGRAVLLASHILDEVERLCDRVSIIRRGRVIRAGPLAEMRAAGRTAVEGVVGRVPAGLAELPGVHGLTVEGNRLRFEADTGRLGAVLRVLADHDLRDLSSRPPKLEELFLRHYRPEESPAGRERAGL